MAWAELQLNGDRTIASSSSSVLSSQVAATDQNTIVDPRASLARHHHMEPLHDGNENFIQNDNDGTFINVFSHRIPRIIHHMYNASEDGSTIKVAHEAYQRWRGANPGWELRFYDLADSERYVRRWFPQYASTYAQLGSEKEKRDLFRYVAVLKHGGVFADASVTVPRPLAEVLRPEDTLVTAWDVEFPSGQAAITNCYIRARQLQHSLFAATPGHPALFETVDRIVATLTTRFSMHPAIDALERTGPGVFTDTVLKHARKHPPAMRTANGHWPIRLLPRKGFGEVVQGSCVHALWDAGHEEYSSSGSGSNSGGEERRRGSRLHWGMASILSLFRGRDDDSSGSSTSGRDVFTDDIVVDREEGGSERLSVQVGGNTMSATATATTTGQGDSNHNKSSGTWWRWLWSYIYTSTSSSSSFRGTAGLRTASDIDPAQHRPDVAIAAHLERLASSHEDAQLFPVSASFNPPFDVMTHLVSHGERQSGWDVSSVVCMYGTWQPSVQPTRRPSLIEAIVGSLGSSSSSSASRSGSGAAAVPTTLFKEVTKQSSSTIINNNSSTQTAAVMLMYPPPMNGVLVDVGAGYGLISLAAAARGHRVHSFELGPRSSQALEASIERNGFGSLVQLHRVPLGSPEQRGPACLEIKAGSGLMGSSGSTSSTGGSTGSSANSANANEGTLLNGLEVARGYADPAVHAVAVNTSSSCARTSLRLPGSEAIPPDDVVGALRISANGWEGFVLQGFLPSIVRHRPPVIAMEWNPVAMKAVGYSNPLDVVDTLGGLGYTDVSHSGFICDERWYALTYGVRRRGGVKPEDIAGMRQPTWCRLLSDEYHLLLEKANSRYPETILFILNHTPGGWEGGARGRGSGGEPADVEVAVVEEERTGRATATTRTSSSDTESEDGSLFILPRGVEVEGKQGDEMTLDVGVVGGEGVLLHPRNTPPVIDTVVAEAVQELEATAAAVDVQQEGDEG